MSLFRRLQRCGVIRGCCFLFLKIPSVKHLRRHAKDLPTLLAFSPIPFPCLAYATVHCQLNHGNCSSLWEMQSGRQWWASSARLFPASQPESSGTGLEGGLQQTKQVYVEVIIILFIIFINMCHFHELCWGFTKNTKHAFSCPLNLKSLT